MTSTDITIIYKDREVLLEVNATGYVPATRHSPEEPPEFEIIAGNWPSGNLLSDDDIEFITKHEDEQIWQKLEDLSEYTREDYLLEKYADRAWDCDRRLK